MGFEYGNTIALQTIRYLGNEQEFPERLVRAFSEIGLISGDDTTLELFQQVIEWREKYLESRLPEISKSKELPKDILITMSEMADDLCQICCDIIKQSAVERFKKESDFKE